jgi:hypothetical protein
MRNEGGREDGKCSEDIWGCGDQCHFVFKFGRHLVLNLFPLPLTPAQLLSDGLPIKGCAAVGFLSGIFSPNRDDFKQKFLKVQKL